ncbi:hypothetical protein [Sorangium sp. So ce693]|uniref:hypothetical protein n=1 Tax=Sorangium sp. So ce693 TaxID=3133318 RepID=UPI003F609B86
MRRVLATHAPPVLPNQYLVYTGYQGPDQPGVTQTWVLPPASIYRGKTPQQPLSVPFLFSGNGDPSTLGVPNDDFIVAASWSGTPTRASVNVTLQLTGKNAWSTGAAARAALRENFLAFLAKIEASFELGSPPLLIPGATSILAAAVVQIMPLPVGEALLYACGLESGRGTGAPPAVDVMPGMRLRSEPSVRQYLAPPTQALSGYVSTGTLAWEVAASTASGSSVQAFDAFLGAVASPQITPPPGSRGPIYGLLDLALANSGYKYHRLVYPQSVIAGSAPGSLDAPTNVTLTGANTLADLRASPPYSASFFGRGVVIPEICVLLAVSSATLQPTWVPLGTTVNNLLERFTRWKPLSTGSAQNVVLLTRPAYSSQQLGWLSGVSVAFAPTSAAITDLRALDLPLWPGDGLLLNLPVGP